MNISSSASSSLLDSVLKAQTTQVDAGVSLLRKAQDIQSREGQALVQMLDEVGPAATENTGAEGFSAYA